MSIRWRQALLALLLRLPSRPVSPMSWKNCASCATRPSVSVNALVEQGVLTRAKADEIIGQANKPGAKARSQAVARAQRRTVGRRRRVEPGMVHVPYVPESVKQEIREEVQRDVLAQAKTERWGEPGAFPDWLNSFTWHGDMRLRCETDQFPPDTRPTRRSRYCRPTA